MHTTQTSQYLKQFTLVISLASLGALAMPLSVSAADQLPADQSKTQSNAFTKLDENRDGYLSLAEFTRDGMLAKSFNEGDDNRDGKLDADEFIKASAINDRVKVGRVVGDSVITAKVKAELLKDTLVKGLKVEVETYQGTVQLSGFVDNERQAARAIELAANIKGVKKVVNNMIVKS